MRKITIGLAAASIMSLGWLGAAPTVASADTQSHTYDTPGALDWQVPAGVSCVSFDVYGADGGDGGDFLLSSNYAAPAVVPKGLSSGLGGEGGLGGRVTGTIQVTPGESIVITVGSHGHDGGDDSAGGVVGGGDGGIKNEGADGGGGGGASDIRQGGSDLAHRALVGGAGGGGGAGGPNGEGGVGGAGGNPATKGGDGAVQNDDEDSQGFGGGPGTQIAGGAAGTQKVGSPPEDPDPVPTAGALGQGGLGGSQGDGAGGGGGGYYGGGGGAPGFGTSGAGGGGGSSFGPTGATFQNGVGADNERDGKVVVTYTVGDTSCVPPAVAPITTNPNFTG